jgi:hypothetical protein
VFQSGEWLLQVDGDGKLVASFRREHLVLTPFWLKQSFVPHAFFPTMEGYVVNSSPFILRLLSSRCYLISSYDVLAFNLLRAAVCMNFDLP